MTEKLAYEKFEDRVAAAYRRMGYRVTQDELVSGNQIDVVARRSDRELATTVIVEAKSHESARSKTGKGQVLDFLKVAEALLRSGACSHASMVTNTGYTRLCKQVVEHDARINLLSIDQIEAQEQANTSYLARQLSNYRTSQIANVFVDLEVSPEADYPASVGAPGLVSDLMTAAIRAGRSPIVITADFGGGKSTIVDHLFFETLSTYLDNESGYLPLRFPLKDLPKFQSLGAFVSDSAKNELGIPFDLGDVLELAKAGDLAVFLDGFDEISSTATAKERGQFLLRLAPLLYTDSPTFLTTRPSYFESGREMERLLRRVRQGRSSRTKTALKDSDRVLGDDGSLIVAQLRSSRSHEVDAAFAEAPLARVRIEPMRPSDITRYVEKFESTWSSLGFSSEDVDRFLDETYDLSDLTTRPLLLSMIVEILRDGWVNPTNADATLGPAKLYAIYVRARLGIEDDKRGDPDSLDEAARHKFAELSAMRMLHDNRLSIAPKLAREFALAVAAPRTDLSPDQRKLRLEGHLTDLRTCSFLTTGPDGDLLFVHRSFQEYFAARHLAGCLLEDDLSEFGALLPEQVAYFLGAIAFEDLECRTAIERALRRQGGRGASRAAERSSQNGNLLAAMAYAGLVAEKLEIVDSLLPPIRKRDVRFLSCQIGTIELTSVTDAAMELHDSRLEGVIRVIGGTLRSIDADSLVGGGIVDLGCELEEVLRSTNSDFNLQLRVGGKGEPIELLHARSSGLTVSSPGGRGIVAIVAEDESCCSLADLRVERVEVCDSYVAVDRTVEVTEVSAKRSTIDLASSSAKGRTVVDIENSLVLLGWGWLSPDEMRLRGVDRSLSEPSRLALSGDIRNCVVLVNPLANLKDLAGLELTESQVFWGSLSAPQPKSRAEARKRFASQLERWGSTTSGIFVKVESAVHPAVKEALELAEPGTLMEVYDGTALADGRLASDWQALTATHGIDQLLKFAAEDLHSRGEPTTAMLVEAARSRRGLARRLRTATAGRRGRER